MTNTEIVEGDELIEKFWIEQGGKPHLKEDISFYESDWNMLMPVVEKIGNIPPNRFVIDNNECKIIGDTKIKVFNASKRLSVYECVIKFITWYNQGKEDEVK
jgi:hypothetical protein